ncbi:hypothetical protein HZA97_09965 [Candidatus Woesearchaeota archaeon]|nr:hypothetical protein [Candidatus Woesearchaeota archaeon]
MGEEKLNWKHVVALILNIVVWPGAGTWLLGKAKLGQLQMIAYFVGAVLVLSEGFGVTGSFATILGFVGMASLVASWVWGNYTLFKGLHEMYS